nr:unnamed protein product [Digitaria exilis]
MSAHPEQKRLQEAVAGIGCRNRCCAWIERRLKFNAWPTPEQWHELDPVAQWAWIKAQYRPFLVAWRSHQQRLGPTFVRACEPREAR